MKTSWEQELSDFIPQDVDLLFTGHRKVLCSRQAIVNFIRAVVKEEKRKMIPEKKEVPSTTILKVRQDTQGCTPYETAWNDCVDQMLADLERDSKK